MSTLALIAILALTPLAVLAAVTVSLAVWGYSRVPDGRPVPAYPSLQGWQCVSKTAALSTHAIATLLVLAVAVAASPPLRLSLILVALGMVGVQYWAVRTAIRPAPDALTVREREALQLILDGKAYAEIAEHFAIAEGEARTLIHDIVRHLGARDADDAAQQLVEAGLLTQR